MVVTRLGMVTVAREMHQAKARSPMEVTLSGMLTDTRSSQL